MIGFWWLLMVILLMPQSYSNPLPIFFILCFLFTFASCQPEPVWTDNCVSVNSNTGTCLQCIQGFYLQYFLCLPCAPLCQCSSQYNYCQTCMVLPYKGTNHSLVPYLNPVAGKCVFCDSSIDYCLACNSSIYCTQCYGGYYPIGQVNSSGIATSSCTGQCSSFCEICINATVCQQCQPGYFLDPITKACTGQCGSNCAQCLTIAICKQCDPGYFLNLTANACQYCNISSCVLCSNESYCDVCGPGYYASNGSCVSTGFDNCVVYIGGAEQASGCQICQPGYFVLYSSCFPCVGCELCSLQFLCQSKCFDNATAFNFACLVPEYMWEERIALMGVGLILMVMLM